jgi:hypothetical protein
LTGNRLDGLCKRRQIIGRRGGLLDVIEASHTKLILERE